MNKDSIELKRESFRITRILMQKDPLVCVKLAKMKLISNLIKHTLPSLKDINELENREEI
jgi:hypothetical protein